MQSLIVYSIGQALGFTSGNLRLWGERARSRFTHYVI
jgi:hypothetical protein